jgi:hypothetical protein
MQGNIARGIVFVPWGVVKAIKNRPYIESPHCKMKIMQGQVFKEGIGTKQQSGGKGIMKKQLLILGIIFMLVAVGCF